nr:MAG TPA_asm: hypothetical protein [Caudoviricetes sp.]
MLSSKQNKCLEVRTNGNHPRYVIWNVFRTITSYC